MGEVIFTSLVREGRIEHSVPTSRTRWLDGTLQQEMIVRRGHEFVRYDWIDVPSEKTP